MSAIVNKVPDTSRASTVSAVPDSNRLPSRGESVGTALGKLFAKTLFPVTANSPIISLFANTLYRATIDNPTMSLLISKTFLFLGTSPQDCNQVTPLHAAAYNRNIGAARKLLDAGANPNAQDCDQWTPLHFAIQSGDVDMTKVLLDAGADPTLKIRDLITPCYYARHQFPRNYELHKLLPITEEGKRFFSSSYLSNIFNWKEQYSSEQGIEIELKGGFAENINPYLAKSLRAFKKEDFFSSLNISEEQFDVLLNAFDETNHSRTNEDIIESINSGKPCFISGGWEIHAITLCFMKRGGKTYMAICNRGQGKQGRSTLEAFEIDPKMLNVDLIEKMKQDNDSPFEERDVFYYSELPSLLHASKVPTRDELWMHIQKFAPSDQKSGNCPLSSAKAAIRFAWMMLLYDSLEVDEVFQQGQKESKLFADFAAVHAWEKYKEETLPGLTDDPSFREAVRAKLTAIAFRSPCIAERASRAIRDLA